MSITAERVALAGFLAGYRGLTREAYALDLRQFASWCRARSVALFAVRRADVEHLGLERGHRTLTITRKGGKVVAVPLAPRTARAMLQRDCRCGAELGFCAAGSVDHGGAG